jgi:hypothetical protein
VVVLEVVAAFAVEAVSVEAAMSVASVEVRISAAAALALHALE